MTESATTREALLDAVRHTDVSFFGSIFDLNLSQIRAEELGWEYVEIEKRALERTLGNEIIQRVGMDVVVESYQDRLHGTQHFSPNACAVLDKYQAEKASE